MDVDDPDVIIIIVVVALKKSTSMARSNARSGRCKNAAGAACVIASVVGLLLTAAGVRASDEESLSAALERRLAELSRNAGSSSFCIGFRFCSSGESEQRKRAVGTARVCGRGRRTRRRPGEVRAGQLRVHRR